jgi:hypothetical protein
MRQKRRLAVLAVGILAAGLAVTLAAAHGGRNAAATAGRGDPAAFLVRTTREKLEGRYANAWASLYPSHKLVAPRDLYVRCEARMPFPGRIVSVRALSKWREPVSIAGLAGKIPAEAVRIRAIVRTPLLAAPVTVTHTFHAVSVEGRWRWILSPSRFRLYSGGGCPSIYSA